MTSLLHVNYVPFTEWERAKTVLSKGRCCVGVHVSEVVNTWGVGVTLVEGEDLREGRLP